MRSVMTHQFSQVPAAQIPRSSFDRSHGLKTTFNASKLVPIFVDEALPGDTFNLRLNAFARMATPIYPVMDNIKLETFFFAVPIRLVWDNFQKMMGEQKNPGDSIDYLVPQMTSTAVTGYAEGSLHDYLGLPTKVAGYDHSSLWHRAYNLIYNEWFRDQNLQNSKVVDVDDGPDSPTDYVLLDSNKAHDYFTSALPWPQKGDSIEMPLGSTAPVWGSHSGTVASAQPADAPIGLFFAGRSVTNGQFWGYPTRLTATGTGTSIVSPLPLIPAPVAISGGSGNYTNENNNMVYADEATSKSVVPGATAPWTADLSSATAATINQLRQAFQLQRLVERDARGGTRYTEIIRSHFGVVSPDARLQRPEYLGGGSSYVNQHVVANTSDTATRKQGDLAAFATASVNGHGFVKSFTEHTLLLGLVRVRADLTYQQGLNRMWSRRTRYDFYWPSLAHIGEQTILNKEIYTQGTAGGTADAGVFGYQERYAEYRYKPSQITGLFRSNATGSLDGWHLSQEFGALPVLNSSFITDAAPMDRVLAVPSEPDFIMDAFFSLKCARPMPLYGVPGLIDHF